MTAVEPILLAACLIYALAAAHDVAARTIPDSCSIALFLLALLRLTLIDGGASAFFDAAVSFGVFAALVMLCAAGLLGGGDAKLIGSSTFLLGFDRLTDFLAATALAGGILALAYLAGYLLLSGLPHAVPAPSGPARRSARRRFGLVLAAEHRRVARKQSIPYGVAIAAGALVTLGGLS
ncbi:prepilin peptidase (plasmid) [Skermanella mucosa]|uniref:prepilin peptidase n=1 Tax=Skermanella mucosa TaxID=1789672 RepID=UPI00192A9EEB|nr:prepilin peptidase [Skermanella mucosa]UEM25095.1 prepilin peptidase [Skermanella mucosa]